MPLNDPRRPGFVARPRLHVLVNGQPIGTEIEANVTANNHFAADRFHCQFALVPSGVGSMAWWGQQKPPVLIDVQIGYLAPGQPEGSAPQWTSIIQGQIDKRKIDPIRGVFECEGRDLTSRFIDAKTQNAYPNKTSSEIVTMLAANHGMTANVTATTMLVGRYYELEHDTISLGQFHRTTTEWDLIVSLARFEGYDAFVTGQTLNFQPPAAQNSNPYALLYGVDQNGNIFGNILDPFAMEWTDTVAKGIQVTVKSWHSKQGRGFIRGYPSNKPVSSVGSGTIQQYVYIRPNLTEDQAQQLAQSLYKEIVQHERIITGSLVPDLILTPRVLMQLTGTGTDFDQTYYPSEITRRLSINGFEMSFSAKNHSPEGDASAGL